MFEQFAPPPAAFVLPAEEAERVARILWTATEATWTMCLAGPTWTDKAARYERMKNPQPGDLVVEVSAGMRQLSCAQAVGWLLRVTREPIPFEEWDEEADGPIPTEDVWYIKALEGHEVRWTNCTFLPVPTYPGWWDAERWRDRDPLNALPRIEAGTGETA